MPAVGPPHVEALNTQIKKRFFEALAALVKRKELGGLKSFATRYELNQGNFYRMRKLESWAVEPAYLYWLAIDFKVRSQWLLTGNGTMFTDSTNGPPTGGPFVVEGDGQMTKNDLKE